MEKKESYLKLLIGEILVSTGYDTSTVFSINSKENNTPDAHTSILIQLFFENYRLNIYNTVSTLPSEKGVNELVGLRIIDVSETKEAAILFFESGFQIIVDLRDEAYSDPEAMYLAGPNDFLVVWN